jgi:transcription antitermination factor NusG
MNDKQCRIPQYVKIIDGPYKGHQGYLMKVYGNKTKVKLFIDNKPTTQFFKNEFVEPIKAVV